MRRRLLTAVLIGTAAWGVFRLLAETDAMARLENLTWDWRIRRTARPSSATDQIRIVLIDQPSLDWARREMKLPWPWPREVYVPILDFCRRAGARAVALDVIFTEPSFAGVADDEALGAALARTGCVAAGVFVGSDGDADAWPADQPRPPDLIEGWQAWMARAGPGAAAIRGARAAMPIPDVATNAAMLASVSDLPDSDGIFRGAALFRVFDDVALPSLGLGVWLAAARAEGTAPQLRITGDSLNAGRTAISLDAMGRARLRFRGPSGTHRAYSAAAIVQSELRLAGQDGAPTVDPKDLRGRYVLIGASAPALLDLRPTPVSRVYPGVEIHATALDNLLHGDFIRPLPRGWGSALALVLCIASSFVGAFARRAWQMGAALAAALAVPVAGGLAAMAGGWAAPVAWPALGAAAAVLGAALYNYATEGRQKAFIKRAFRHYLGPEVIEQILADPSSLRLGGEKRELTIFFSDIEKFSSFSERLEPAELTRLLNEYLTLMGHEILREGGYVDKYIGDAIVAFWNAPVGQPDHGARAVRAASACQRALDERRAEWAERYGAEIRMRIGLNTGEVIVGNMGSDDRFNYTVLGDAANLASRLEGANKQFASRIMAAESVRRAAGDQFHWRRLGRIRVVGRASPVTIFEPIGLATEPTPAWWAEYEAALSLVEVGRFAEAAEAFGRIEGDPVSRRYADLCRRMAADPPPAWEAVWNLTEK